MKKHISSLTVPYLKTDANGNLHLDSKHNYYYQVQGQLLCTGKSRSYFVVYAKKDFFCRKLIEMTRLSMKW